MFPIHDSFPSKVTEFPKLIINYTKQNVSTFQINHSIRKHEFIQPTCTTIATKSSAPARSSNNKFKSELESSKGSQIVVCEQRRKTAFYLQLNTNQIQKVIPIANSIPNQNRTYWIKTELIRNNSEPIQCWANQKCDSAANTE